MDMYRATSQQDVVDPQLFFRFQPTMCLAHSETNKFRLRQLTTRSRRQVRGQEDMSVILTGGHGLEPERPGHDLGSDLRPRFDRRNRLGDSSPRFHYQIQEYFPVSVTPVGGGQMLGQCLIRWRR